MTRRNVWVTLAAGAVAAMSALGLATPSQASGGGHDGQEITILDDCHAASFNAIRPGICVGEGETTFAAFIAELTATRKAAEWRFDPSKLTIRGGRPVILENDGGETHTFTMVKAFGGGFIAPLNQLSGNLIPAGECASTLPDGKLVPMPESPVNVFVDADKEAAFQTAGLKPGTYMFECCIHPWMRVVLTVK